MVAMVLMLCGCKDAFDYVFNRPINTAAIRRLTPQRAKWLAKEFKGARLILDGLATLDADTAKALAEFKGEWLTLAGLATLDADTAKALTEFKGCLFLNGLTTLDADTAATLRANPAIQFPGR
jgi:hypothetical protein